MIRIVEPPWRGKRQEYVYTSYSLPSIVMALPSFHPWTTQTPFYVLILACGGMSQMVYYRVMSDSTNYIVNRHQPQKILKLTNHPVLLWPLCEYWVSSTNEMHISCESQKPLCSVRWVEKKTRMFPHFTKGHTATSTQPLVPRKPYWVKWAHPRLPLQCRKVLLWVFIPLT